MRVGFVTRAVIVECRPDTFYLLQWGAFRTLRIQISCPFQSLCFHGLHPRCVLVSISKSNPHFQGIKKKFLIVHLVMQNIQKVTNKLRFHQLEVNVIMCSGENYIMSNLMVMFLAKNMIRCEQN